MERLFRRPFGLCFMHPVGFATVNFYLPAPGREGEMEGGVTICGLQIEW